MDEEKTRLADAGHDEHFVALHSGFRLGKYELQAVLGQGGFGITYKALDTELNRAVAIKEYLPSDVAVRVDGSTVRARSRNDQDSFQWGLERFLDEARALARFDHSGSVVRVYDYMQANGTAYMVMALIEGEPLGALFRREAPLSEERLKAIVLPVLDGLDDVHEAGFLHRDIKPANILIRPNGQPVLIDFGAARQALGEKSRSITSVFTPGYAPFEQYTSSGKQGPWTDIYALAATLYHGISGKAPPQATDRIREDPMEPAARLGAGRYSPQFLAAIDAGLEVFENRRPQEIAQWRAMLTGEALAVAPAMPFTVAQNAEAAPPAPPSVTSPSVTSSSSSPAMSPSMAAPPRRRGRLGVIVAVVALLMVAGGGYAAWTSIEADRIETEKKLQAEAEAREQAEKAAAELQAREIARQQAESEAKAKAAVEAQRRADAEAARKFEEAEARKRAEAEAKIRAETEARMRAEFESKRKADADAQRKAAEAEAARQAETARRQAEADRRQEEAEAKRKAAEDARAQAEEKVRAAAARTAAAQAKQQAAVPAFAYAGQWQLVIQCPNTPVSPFTDYPINVSGPTFANTFYRDGKGKGSFSGNSVSYEFGFTGRSGSYLSGRMTLSANGANRFSGGGQVIGFGQGGQERACSAAMTRK